MASDLETVMTDRTDADRQREQYVEALRRDAETNNYFGGILCDWQIEARLALPETNRRHMRLAPFSPPFKEKGKVSHGLSSMGYDIRLGENFLIFTGPEQLVADMSNEGAAWVAGIIDGEGNLGYSTKGNSSGVRYPRIKVTMTCQKTLRMLRQITGVGKVYTNNNGEPRHEGHKPTYCWQVGRTKEVQQLLVRIFPYMTTKRVEAEEMVSKDYGTAGCTTVVDPVHFKDDGFQPHNGKSCVIPPNSFILAESVEKCVIPEDVLCQVVGKSTYARCGVGLTMTPLEPGWRGVITIEIANHTRLPAKVYANQGIGQVLFFESKFFPAKPYNKKSGASYQGQTGLTPPRV